MDAAAQYVSDAGPENEYVEDIKTFFGSLFMTLLTLFMTVAGGVDWWEVMRLTLEIHTICGLVFVLFVTITVLAVLNVINAVFVNDAIESTRTDHDLRVHGELEETRLVLESLTAIFEKMESKESDEGLIPERFFVEQVEREETKMQFALPGLYDTDGLNFFRFLDIEANHTLSIDQFVMGCLRLKGGALLIDTKVLLEDTRTLVVSAGRANKHAMDAIVNHLKDVHEKLDKLELDMH